MSLACNLMCASSCAYGVSSPHLPVGIGHKAAYTPQEPMDAALTWLSGPFPYAEGPDNIDAVLIGEIENVDSNGTNGLVIAFRGTEAPSTDHWDGLLDWLNDLLTSPTDPGHSIAGKVHSGFWDSLDNLWDHVKDAAKDAVQDGLPIYITGHSKGAGIAPLAAARLAAEEGINAAGVYIFAPPNCGDSDFVSGFASAWPDIPVVSYENYLDIVPFLPPTPTFISDIKDTHEFFYDLLHGYADDNYASIGTLNYIQSDGTVVTGGDIPSDLDRFNPIASDVPFNVTPIEYAHCHGCKASKCAGGYMQGACDGTVCNC